MLSPNAWVNFFISDAHLSDNIEMMGNSLQHFINLLFDIHHQKHLLEVYFSITSFLLVCLNNSSIILSIGIIYQQTALNIRSCC
jgi:hypothetical protein